MAKKRAKKRATAKKKTPARGRPKGIKVKNFTGVIRQNADKTIGIFGRGKRVGTIR